MAMLEDLPQVTEKANYMVMDEAIGTTREDFKGWIRQNMKQQQRGAEKYLKFKLVHLLVAIAEVGANNKFRSI